MTLATYRLKRLGDRDLEAALGKAEQYRALNEPEEAESICRDVLIEQPEHQRALRTLGLSLTDRFDEEWSAFFDDAVAAFQKMKNEYEKTYLVGVAWERAAKAQVKRGQIRNAVHSFEQALTCFAEAERIGPANTPDPILRWNRCIRAIEAHPELVEELRERRDSHEFQHGD
jgi:tetratricopeptide (TPR) repeat protein